MAAERALHLQGPPRPSEPGARGPGCPVREQPVKLCRSSLRGSSRPQGVPPLAAHRPLPGPGPLAGVSPRELGGTGLAGPGPRPALHPPAPALPGPAPEALRAKDVVGPAGKPLARRKPPGRPRRDPRSPERPLPTGNTRTSPPGLPRPGPPRAPTGSLTGRGRPGARPTRRARPGGGRPRAHNGARARPHPGSPGAGWRGAGPCRPTRSLLARRGSPWRQLADPHRLSLPARFLRGSGAAAPGEDRGRGGTPRPRPAPPRQPIGPAPPEGGVSSPAPPPARRPIGPASKSPSLRPPPLHPIGSLRVLAPPHWPRPVTSAAVARLGRLPSTGCNRGGLPQLSGVGRARHWRRFSAAAGSGTSGGRGRAAARGQSRPQPLLRGLSVPKLVTTSPLQKRLGLKPQRGRYC